MMLFLRPRHLRETIFALACVGIVTYYSRFVILPTARPVLGDTYQPVDFGKVGPILAAVCIALGVRSDLEPWEKLAARALSVWRLLYCSVAVVLAFIFLLPSALRDQQSSMIQIFTVNLVAATGITLALVSVAGWLLASLIVIPYGLLGLEAGQAMPHVLQYIFNQHNAGSGVQWPGGVDPLNWDVVPCPLWFTSCGLIRR